MARPLYANESFGARRTYPAGLRCVRFRDSQTDRIFTFLTNNFAAPFYGYSEDAVKTQIWIAVSFNRVDCDLPGCRDRF